MSNITTSDSERWHHVSALNHHSLHCVIHIYFVDIRSKKITFRTRSYCDETFFLYLYKLASSVWRRLEPPADHFSLGTACRRALKASSKTLISLQISYNNISFKPAKHFTSSRESSGGQNCRKRSHRKDLTPVPKEWEDCMNLLILQAQKICLRVL